MVKHLLAAVLSAATLAGCNVSGVAEKGPFQAGSTVTASVLRNDASLSSALSIQTAVTDALGSYRIESDISWNVWIQLEASGSYFNELTGVVSEEALALKATTRTNGSFSRANINLFSHLVTARFQQRVSDGLNLRRAYNRSERDLRNVFGISRRSTALSVADGRSRRRQDNANLALFSGALLSLPDTAVALDNLTQDFADDGLFNGVGEATFAAIALKSAEAGLLTTIRDNLIANGATNPPDETDLGELPEWVDTEGEPPVEENTAPVAAATTAQGDEDTTIEISLVAADAEGDLLTFSTTTAANGSVSVVGSTATYTPNLNFYGTDSFTFTVSDGQLSDSALVELDVNGVDDLPSAEDINAGIVTSGESTDIFLVGADIDSEITFTATDGSLGSVTVNESSELGVIATYNAGRLAGEDSFTYQVTGDGQSVTATVSIIVEPIPVPQGELLGSVRDTNGNLIAGVTVDVLGSSNELDAPADYVTNTDETGQFVVSADADTERVLVLRKTGYADQVVPVRFLDGSAPLNVVMIQRGVVQIVDADIGGVVVGSDGATVVVVPSMFVDASGESVTGDIEVIVTPLDVSNKALLAAFPGAFYGVSGEGSEINIIATLGTTEFTFTQNGQPLTVRPKSRVDIILPIYNSVNPGTGLEIVVNDSIALWSLNESTGIWEQEGEGTVIGSADSPTGLALAAGVSHFSWWNVDVSILPSGLEVQVNTPLLSDGTEIASDIGVLHALAGTGFGWRSSQADTILSVGETTVVDGLPSNANICFWVEYVINAGGTLNSAQQCIDTVEFGFYNLTFDVTVSSDPLVLAVQDSQASYAILKAIKPIKVVSTTPETVVDYTLVGELPAGLSLVQVSSTGAEIQGIPTESGSAEVAIEGVDSEGNVSRINQTVIVEALDVPVLEGDGFSDLEGASISIYRDINSQFGPGFVQIDLSAYNVGGVATSWTNTLPDSLEYPYSVSITDDGLMSFFNRSEPVNGSVVSESFSVRAVNSEGASNPMQVNLDIYYTVCDYESEIDSENCFIFVTQ